MGGFAQVYVHPTADLALLTLEDEADAAELANLGVHPLFISHTPLSHFAGFASDSDERVLAFAGHELVHKSASTATSAMTPDEQNSMRPVVAAGRMVAVFADRCFARTVPSPLVMGMCGGPVLTDQVRLSSALHCHAAPILSNAYLVARASWYSRNPPP